MIRSIELKNWKTHGHTMLDFSRGTNILLGSMGSGKSTVMDAIAFALFGTYPALQHRRLGVGEIIKSRPEQKSRASVRLTFDIDGDSYEVERAIELDGPGRATLSKGGASLQSQPKRVNEEIERLLKVDYDLFSRAVYSEQNRLTYFLELRPGERKEQIDELLGLDKFALAQDNVGSLINKIRDSVSENEKTLAALDVKKAREQYESLLAEANEATKGVKSAREALERRDKDKSKAEELLNDAKSQFKRKAEIAQQIAELKSKAEVISSEIEKIRSGGVKDKKSIAKAIEEATAALEKLRKAEKDATDKDKVAREALVHAESDAKSAAKESEEKERLVKERGTADRKKIEEAAKPGAERLKSLRESYEANVAAKNENERWLRELEKHSSKCPTCERELAQEARDRLLLERRKAAKRLEEETASQKRDIAILDKNVEDSSKELQRIAAIDERLSLYKGIDAKLKESREKLAKARKESEAANAKKEDASNSVSKVKEKLLELDSEREAADRLERHVTEKEKASKSLAEKEKEVGTITIDQKKIDALQEEFTSLSSELRELQARLESDSKRAKEKAEQAQEKKKSLEMLERMLEDIEKRKKAVENLKKFRNALEEAQTALRARLIGSINEVMQEIWPELYPYGDYQGLALEPGADDYALKVRTGNEKWEDVNAIASGGEKSIACLAMRVAFALVLVPNLKWIILDEPTHNIDREGIARFVRSISEVMPRLIDQVFIITHDEMLKQVANARVYTLSRNKEESGDTVVEAF